MKEEVRKRKGTKAINRFVLLFFSFIIGMGIVMQINMTQKFTGSSTTSQRIRTLQIELKNLKTKRERMEAEVETLERGLEQLRSEDVEQSDIELKLKKEIEEYEELIGYRSIVGRGIVLELKESFEKDSSVLINNYELLLALINKLNAAGAEAVCINDERYVITTSIKSQESSLFINNREMKPPIVVKAIGDADTLEAAMNFRYGILWEMRNYYGVEADVSKQEEIEIPGYRGLIDYRFASPVEN